MATITPFNTVRNVLERRKPVMRLSEIIDDSQASELRVRRDAELLEADGAVSRFVVGQEVFIRLNS